MRTFVHKSAIVTSWNLSHVRATELKQHLQCKVLKREVHYKTTVQTALACIGFSLVTKW